MHQRSLFTHLLFFLFTLISTSPAFATDAKDFRILLTNDDGINAQGLHALVKTLSPHYDVVVSAPAKKWGGRSHGTLLWEGPMEVSKFNLKNTTSDTPAYHVSAYSVQGLPADAARFGIIQQREKNQAVDLVISGINHGENLGSLSHLSGTIGSAMEGAYYGIPAIAVSIESKAAKENKFEAATQAVLTLVEGIRENGLPKGVVLNVNVPENAKGGMRIAPMDHDNVKVDGFTQTGDKFEPTFSYPKANLSYSDMTVYEQGLIAVTPIQLDWTDHEAIKLMNTWDLDN
ncbi:5'/3'-nucleotidase SurE [Arenicella xantha]|uniref:5'-nucleotidase SurE n=1 Tax=Arenicella xantha TaxID=644221 RepID=A0A395JRG3_9GAMM|nr:5'/3'-nucleotidase SurE [Arenicella xantha]RBP52922.1 5'-nucleotidase /3'-nucleotidase /exopolyphosphatase [Arenicella xantha]